MIIGIIAISAAYRKFSSLIKSKKIFYTRPHLSRFVQNAVLPFFAIALISSTNAYIQTSELFENDSNSMTMELSAEETFAKILNTFNILVVGYTISHLIPIMLTKRDKSILEKQDFDAWYDLQGFSDDDNLFTNYTNGFLQQLHQRILQKKNSKIYVKLKKALFN